MEKEREGSEGAGIVSQSQESGVSDSTGADGKPATKKVKPSPIVWGQPSSSTCE